MNQLAAYVDQVADDPYRSLALLQQLGLHYVVVERLWTTALLEVKEHLLEEFRKECAKCNVEILANEVDSHTDRVPLIASYLKNPYVIYKQQPTIQQIVDSVQANYVPVTYYTQGAEKSSSRLKWLFDPCLLPATRAPSVWQNDSNFFGISVHDRDYVSGPKPLGYGKSGVLEVVQKATDKWLLVKPSLGRRYGSLETREDIFKENLNLLRAVLPKES